MKPRSIRTTGRPEPLDPDAVDRWRYQDRTWRILHGKWKDDAEERLRWSFHEDVWEHLPPAICILNVALSLYSQTATLYDEGVRLLWPSREPSGRSLSLLNLAELWSVQADTLLHVRAMNEAFLCRSWEPVRGRVAYRSVPANMIDDESHGGDPMQPDVVRELRERDGAYQWEVWDRRTWTFTVYEVDDDTDAPTDSPWGRDVTLRVFPELASHPGRWPWWTEPAEAPDPDDPAAELATPGGEPIWPWTKFHSRTHSTLSNPWEGLEVIEGTLDIAVALTYWFGGLRDASFNQRWVADGQPVGAKAGGKVQQLPVSPMAILFLQSTGPPGSTVRAGEWSSSLDIGTTLEAIAALAAALGLFAGLASGDVSVSSQGLSRVSGAAIQVSREGKRRIERKLRHPMSVGDRHNLAGAAELANAYGDAAALPTDRDAYHPVYASTPKTTQEIQSEVERRTTLVDAGLEHPADAYRRDHPELTRDQAKAELLEIAAFKRELEQARRGAPTDTDTDTDDDDDDDDTDTDDTNDDDRDQADDDT